MTVTASIGPLSKQQFNQNGVPLANGKLFTYITGTSTKQATYSDVGLTLNTNPIILDANGQCDLWLDNSITYRLVLSPSTDTDPPTNAFWTEDNVVSSNSITTSLAASTGAGLIGWVRSVAGAIATTLATWLGWQPVNLFEFMTSAEIADYIAGTASLDITAALNAAYAAADSKHKDLILPAGVGKHTSQLVWNKAVNVRAQLTSNTTVGSATLLKHGNFDGVLITASAADCSFDGITFKGDTGNGGRGVVLKDVSYTAFPRCISIGHAGSNWYIDDTIGSLGSYFNDFRDVQSTSSGSHGFEIDSTGNTGAFGACNTCMFDNLHCIGNTGKGFYQHGYAAAGYHSGKNIVCEQNAGGGVSIDGIGNVLEFYAEANTTSDFQLETSSVRNYIVVKASSITPTDLGTNNIIIATGLSGKVYATAFGAFKQGANSAGRSTSIIGGAAGAGATANAGGALFLTGGDSDGTAGNGDGGAVRLEGGQPINAGVHGVILMQPNNDAGVVIGGDVGATDNTSISLQFNGTTRAPMMIRLTTTQRDALTAVNGMGPIYNTTLNKFQVYENSAWVSIV